MLSRRPPSWLASGINASSRERTRCGSDFVSFLRLASGRKPSPYKTGWIVKTDRSEAVPIPPWSPRLVVGIANQNSIATGCAIRFREAGAGLAIYYLNERAKPFVRTISDALGAPIVLPCDLTAPGRARSGIRAHHTRFGEARFLTPFGRLRSTRGFAREPRRLFGERVLAGNERVVPFVHQNGEWVRSRPRSSGAYDI
jgi:Enoyl-(Acyl carrier protein) reductase